MTELISIDDIRAAASAISDYVLRTPSVMSPGLSDLLDATIAIKPEALQPYGCFKVRGVTNKILSLSEEERARGLVTVSGGNHGLVVASIAEAMGLRAVICMPDKVPERSKDIVRVAGADLRLAADVATAFATAEAERENGLTYIHSYDDPLILAGHGTTGLEFVEDIPELTDIIVSIGGGGLISGVAAAAKALNPGIRIWGVETEGANCMSQALDAGEPVTISVSSIVSTLAAPFATERTLAHVSAMVEEVITVSDAQAVAGVVAMAEAARIWVEPAGGCLIPAAKQVIERVGPDATIGLVLCGGNATFADVVHWADDLGVSSRT